MAFLNAEIDCLETSNLRQIVQASRRQRSETQVKIADAPVSALGLGPLVAKEEIGYYKIDMGGVYLEK